MEKIILTDYVKLGLRLMKLIILKPFQMNLVDKYRLVKGEILPVCYKS